MVFDCAGGVFGGGGGRQINVRVEGGMEVNLIKSGPVVKRGGRGEGGEGV